MSDAGYIAQVVTLYWTVSICMVYLNKVLLSSEDASIPAPMFVTWFQCVVTALICVVLGNMGERTRKEGRSSFLNDYPVCKYNSETGIRVLPLSLIFVGMIAFNNICLKHVEVSFYNVARSLSIVFNVLFTYLVLGKETSVMTCSTLLIVIFGFYLGIDGEINLSVIGTAAGVLASVFVSLNGIYTAKILPAVNNDKSMLLFYNNINASFLFIPFIILFEGQTIVDNATKLVSLVFWSGMVMSGLMGFGIGLVTVMQVRATSPLTHNISGTAKAAFQSLMAFYIWGNEYTFNGIAGIFLVIFGSGLYTYVQMQKPAKKSEVLPSADTGSKQ
ncbi:unnamed protein product [Ectocarpus fasciculatus]